MALSGDGDAIVKSAHRRDISRRRSRGRRGRQAHRLEFGLRFAEFGQDPQSVSAASASSIRLMAKPTPQADGAAQSGLSRSALPPPSLRPGVRRLARRSRRATRLPRHGRPSRARVRALQRGRTRPRVASGSRRRRPSRSRCADRTLPAKGRSIACRRRQAALPRHLRSDRDKRFVPLRQILPGVGVEIGEGRRETVAAMLLGNAAQRPQGVL